MLSIPHPSNRGAASEPVEVVSKPKKRTFTAEYKLRILAEAEAVTESGGVAAILRREGLYSSHLIDWRVARAKGELDGLAARKPGPRPRRDEADLRRIAELEREVARLTKRAERAEGLVELQKKVAELLRGLETPKEPS